MESVTWEFHNLYFSRMLLGLLSKGGCDGRAMQHASNKLKIAYIKIIEGNFKELDIGGMEI